MAQSHVKQEAAIRRLIHLWPMRVIAVVLVISLFVLAVLSAAAWAQDGANSPHRGTCDTPPEQVDPHLGAASFTSSTPAYPVDGLKVKPLVQFTYPHQVMVQAKVVGNALHGDISDLHVALVYTAPDGTENDCKQLKGTVYSWHGNYVDDVITSYWWVQKPNKGDRVHLEVQVTVTNPETIYTQQFGKIKHLRIPIPRK